MLRRNLLFNVDSRRQNVIYKCTVSIKITADKKYVGLPQGDFKKQHFYNHKQSFKNKNYSNSTALSSYVWKMK